MHPAMRVLVMAWVAGLAQTSGVAAMWGVFLAAGLVASRRAAAAAAPTTAPNAVEPEPAPAALPARRRTDAARETAPPCLPAPPSLKSHHDTLTGTTTREYLDAVCDAWMQELHTRGLSLCVLHVGLSGLKAVTERYGQHAGDHVLVQAAKRLRHLARQEDILMRASDAGFVLLLSCPPQDTRGFARNLATRVITELQRPLAYRTVSNLHIGCSVGSAAWPLNGSTLDEVMRHAEEAFTLARPGAHGQTWHYAGQGSAGQGPAIAA
jgi:diguanylate cyclase (GGDEF)-like protein